MRLFYQTLIIVLLGINTAQSENKIQKIQLRTPIEFRNPILNDSINNKGERFSNTELLKTPLKLEFPEEETSVISLDTSNTIKLAKATDKNLFYLAGWQMRAENFLKAKLKITSAARWELYLNGSSKKIKNSNEESLDKAVSMNIDLQMEPESDIELTLKILSLKGDKTSPDVKIEFIPEESFKDVSVTSAPSMKKRFALKNTVYGERVTGISISPNGDYLITTFKNTIDENRSVTRRELRSLKQNKIITSNLREGMQWMPKSNNLYYSSQTEKGFDVIIVNPSTLEEKILLNDIPENNFTWSPQEDYLIFFPHEAGINEQGSVKQIISPADRIPNTRGRYFLARYDIASGVTERLTFGCHNTYLNSISPDGKYILYSSSWEDLNNREYSSGSLFLLELATLKIDTIQHNDPFATSGHFSPDGTQLLLIGSAEAFNGIGKNCGSHPIANDFDNQAFILTLKRDSNGNFPIKAITKEFNPTVNFIQWNEDNNCIYFSTNDKDCRNIYKYDPQKEAFEKLPLKTDIVQKFVIGSKNSTTAAYFGQGNDYAGIEYLYNSKKKTSTLLANPFDKTLSNIELGKMKEWKFTASDGTEIDGMICLPPAFDSKKKYPLIVYYYSGTTPTERGISSPYCAQLFASRNYVVYVVQPSGTIGYGQEFSARHVNAWGKRTADDIIEGVKQFCKEHPFVNSKKIGCLGASYGGFMTMYLQTQTDIFAAAASHAGISNVTSYWGEGYWGYSYNSIAAAGSYPWNNPDLFTKQGALFNADKIQTPLLLLHGTADTNVPIGESIQLFNALKILGKEVAFIEVEGENHFIADYKKRVIWHASIMAWFEKWLKGKPAWWNNLYPKRYL